MGSLIYRHFGFQVIWPNRGEFDPDALGHSVLAQRVQGFQCEAFLKYSHAI
jgi:hypothetical protein